MEQLDETDRKTLGAWLLAERGAHSALRREPPREDHERARRGRGERLARLAELQTKSRQRLGTLARGTKDLCFGRRDSITVPGPLRQSLGGAGTQAQ